MTLSGGKITRQVFSDGSYLDSYPEIHASFIRFRCD